MAGGQAGRTPAPAAGRPRRPRRVVRATPRALPQAPPAPNPAPILKRVRGSGGDRDSKGGPRGSVEFSPATTDEREEEEEGEEAEESDTDVGSHCNDESFELNDSLDDSMDGAVDRSGDVSPPPSIARVGAKVRRLNLADDGGNDGDNNDNDDNYRRNTDVKKTLARSSLERLGSPRESARKESKGRRRGAVAGSPPGDEGRQVPGKASGAPENLLVCPPSTLKKGKGVSRLFAHAGNDADEDDSLDFPRRRGINSGNYGAEDGFGGIEEEDVSPRDVMEFPFFPSPGRDGGKHEAGRGKENRKISGRSISGEKMMASSYNGHDEGSVGAENYCAGPSPPPLSSPPRPPSTRCPPTTIKTKPNRRLMDLGDGDRMMECENDGIGGSALVAYDGDSSSNGGRNDSDSSGNNCFDIDGALVPTARSPPRGLRSLGRANSFLQMFSQGSVEALKGIDEENDDAADAGDDDDNGFLRRPVPSPKRPMRSHRRRRLPGMDDDDDGRGSSNVRSDLDQPVHRRTTSFSRFAADFEVVGTLGSGSFGSVFRVRHRTDRRLYAIKSARREARGRADRDRMMREVYALAEVGDRDAHDGSRHVVRYHQAWMEGRRLYIQTELCEGTLLDEMKRGLLKDEGRRCKLLREVLLALDLVHESRMIHLDIKPENIFVKGGRYKLGDFGLVSTSGEGGNDADVEEGDSRYVSRELLEGDSDDLTKSDIFSLGATVYEICLDRPHPFALPENGPEWHALRDGHLLPTPRTSSDLRGILEEMMHPDRTRRPSARDLLGRRKLMSDEERMLIAERNRAEAANVALDAQMQRFKLMSSPDNLRKKFHRSNTIC